MSLEDRTITAGGLSVGFDIDPVRRTKLMNGWDDIDLTRSHLDEISRFRDGLRQNHPWNFLARE